MRVHSIVALFLKFQLIVRHRRISLKIDGIHTHEQKILHDTKDKMRGNGNLSSKQELEKDNFLSRRMKQKRDDN